MIVLSNTNAQTVAVGESVVFNTQILKGGCAECHRKNSGAVTLHGSGPYVISFSANVGGDTAATPVQLTIRADGDNLPETTMISVPAAATDFNNVSTTTATLGCCDCNRITVVNTGTTPINIAANPVLYIHH